MAKKRTLEAVLLMSLSMGIPGTIMPWAFGPHHHHHMDPRKPASLNEDLGTKGYRISSLKLANSHLYTPAWEKTFKQTRKRYGDRLPHKLPKEFDSVKEQILRYALKNAAGSNPKKLEIQNGVTFDVLSERIVRSAYCFRVDPFVLAAKIKRETRFKMDARPSRSPTSAVGLTQMTPPAIREVNEQLWPRENSKTNELMRASFNCVSRDMKTMISGTDGLTKQQWLLGRNSKRGLTRINAADRQITYGAALLKIYLSKFDDYLPALYEYGPGTETYAPAILEEADQIAMRLPEKENKRISSR